jgi:hypothetical protein
LSVARLNRTDGAGSLGPDPARSLVGWRTRIVQVVDPCVLGGAPRESVDNRQMAELRRITVIGDCAVLVVGRGDARGWRAMSAVACRLDRNDADLLHAHHRIKCTLCFTSTESHSNRPVNKLLILFQQPAKTFSATKAPGRIDSRQSPPMGRAARSHQNAGRAPIQGAGRGPSARLSC